MLFQAAIGHEVEQHKSNKKEHLLLGNSHSCQELDEKGENQ